MNQAQQDISALTGQLSPEQLALLEKASDGVQVQKSASQDSEEDVLYVQDRLADTPRRHDLVDGNGVIRAYNFKSQFDWVEVPYSAAIRLVTNDGFIVKDAEGNILKVSERQGDAGGPVQLLNTQCVAYFEELIQDALIDRCKAAGKPATRRTPKEEMVAYLIDINRQIEGRYGVDDDGLDAANEVEV